MEKIFVKPAQGVDVRHPSKINYLLNPEGEWVKLNRDWRRMLLQGDIVRAEPPKQQELQPKKEKAEETNLPTANILDNQSTEGDENDQLQTNTK